MRNKDVLHTLGELRRNGLTEALLAEYEARYLRVTQAHPDEETYFPFIIAARRQELQPIRSLTEWKNAAANGRPRAFFGKQWAAWNRIAMITKHHQGTVTSGILRTAFDKSAPVWSLFWHHALFGTPIFDRYTHAAYLFFVFRRTVQAKESVIPRGRHWELYDAYGGWFHEVALAMNKSATDIQQQRWIDRALFEIGKDVLAQDGGVSGYCGVS